MHRGGLKPALRITRASFSSSVRVMPQAQKQTQRNGQPRRRTVCLLQGNVDFHGLLGAADLDAAVDGDDLAALGEGDVEGDGGRLGGELLDGFALKHSERDLGSWIVELLYTIKPPSA
jgi:hypothetical protein